MIGHRINTHATHTFCLMISADASNSLQSYSTLECPQPLPVCFERHQESRYGCESMPLKIWVWSEVHCIFFKTCSCRQSYKALFFFITLIITSYIFNMPCRHSSLNIMKVTWGCNFSYLPLGNKRNLSQINLIMIFTVQYIRYMHYQWRN